MTPRCLTRLALGGLAGIALFACGNDDADASGATGDVTVFAAASLTDAFEELGAAFTTAHPGADVTFNFAGSAELAAQIVEGAPADVFAAADQHNMRTVTDAGGHATEPVVFTTNRAEIVVEPGNPHGISGLADLIDDELIVVACSPEVPCGRYAEQVLDNAGLGVTFKSLEHNVRAVVSKVVIGEADAGIVYATDVIAAGDAVHGVPIPDDVNVVAEYPIAVTRGAAHPEAAEAFVDFVLSSAGQSILESHGFAAP